MSPEGGSGRPVVAKMSSDERLQLIADLLSGSPTTSGVIGRETAAATALARGVEIDTLIGLLSDAELVGSRAASECLARLTLAGSIG